MTARIMNVTFNAGNPRITIDTETVPMPYTRTGETVDQYTVVVSGFPEIEVSVVLNIIGAAALLSALQAIPAVAKRVAQRKAEETRLAKKRAKREQGIT